MIKQISTYGALLLTTMVVIRATTMERESEAEVRSLYERQADRTYVSFNMAMRSDYEANPTYTPNLLAFARKTEKVFTPQRHAVHQQISEETEPFYFEEPLDLVLEAEFVLPSGTDFDESEAGLSLDRESTINNGLSLLFPRQRINPKPSPAQLND